MVTTLKVTHWPDQWSRYHFTRGKCFSIGFPKKAWLIFWVSFEYLWSLRWKERSKNRNPFNVVLLAVFSRSIFCSGKSGNFIMYVQHDRKQTAVKRLGWKLVGRLKMTERHAAPTSNQINITTQFLCISVVKFYDIKWEALFRGRFIEYLFHRIRWMALWQ